VKLRWGRKGDGGRGRGKRGLGKNRGEVATYLPHRLCDLGDRVRAGEVVGIGFNAPEGEGEAEWNFDEEGDDAGEKGRAGDSYEM